MAKRRPRNSNRHPNAPKTNLYDVIRDVLIASLNKGQFLVALIFFVILALIWKMPSEDVSKITFEILYLFKSFHLVGWSIAVATSISWFYHSKYQRRIHYREMSRKTSIIDRLQKRQLGNKLQSTK